MHGTVTSLITVPTESYEYLIVVLNIQVTFGGNLQELKNSKVFYNLDMAQKTEFDSCFQIHVKKRRLSTFIHLHSVMILISMGTSRHLPAIIIKHIEITGLTCH